MTLRLISLLESISAGDVSSEDAINLYYDNILNNEGLSAWVTLASRDDVLNRYRENKTFYDKSVLKGLPFGVKDVIDTSGIKTSSGSPIYADRVPFSDAVCVMKLKAAGGQVVGKTVTTEFACFHPGPTLNPYDLDCTPGGSSSGSAVAVTTNMVPFALGTQTAASIVRPASYCGTYAYVASVGEISLRGVQPLSQSCDTLGFFCNDVLGLKLLRSILTDNKISVDLKRSSQKKFCVVGSDILGPVDDEMERAVNKFSKKLMAKGLCEVDFEPVVDVESLSEAHKVVMAYEVSRNFHYEYCFPEQLSERFLEIMDFGFSISHNDYEKARNFVFFEKVKLVDFMRHVDFLLCPASEGVAPRGVHNTGSPHMSRAWQILGLPVVVLPAEFYQGMPMGIQMIGRPYSDDELMDMALYVAGG